MGAREEQAACPACEASRRAHARPRARARERAATPPDARLTPPTAFSIIGAMRELAAGALLLALAAFAGCRTAPPAPTLYSWADAEGNVRYTMQPGLVPRSARDTLTPVVPGRSAQANAEALPGSTTEPRPPQTAREWLKGGPPEETDAGAAASAAEVSEQAKVPTKPEEIAALDARIRELEQQVTEAEVSLAQRMGEKDAEGNPVDEASVREEADRLPQLQAELAELRARRELVVPADGS
jgi:hypothetical protein